MKFWIARRIGSHGVEDSISIPALNAVQIQDFPLVIMTDTSVSALGELVCVVSTQDKAELLLKALVRSEAEGFLE